MAENDDRKRGADSVPDDAVRMASSLDGELTALNARADKQAAVDQIERQREVARRIMRENRAVLHELAK